MISKQRGAVLEIVFADRKLEKICNDHKILVRKYGHTNAKRIRRRLDDLDAAENLAVMKSLFPGRLHPLTGDKSGQFSLDLVHPLRLIFEPADEPPAIKEDGSIDWVRVQRVRIVSIEDTHNR